MAEDSNGLPFINEDDRRIRDLQQQAAVLLTDYLAMDRPGLYSAMRITIQQIVNIVNTNLNFPLFYAGAVNPDNAFGKNSDGYFTIPVDGSRLQFFQKIDGTWLSVFNLPLLTQVVNTLTFTAANLVEESYGGVWYLPLDTDKTIVSVGVTLASAPGITTYIDSSQIYKNTDLSPSIRISGFASNVPQTITIKTI